MPGHLSIAARCQRLAGRVTAHLLAEPADALSQSLAKVMALAEGDPAFMLAHDPDADLHRELVRERVARFERRGCRQLAPEAWEAETREIARILENRFAERFRRQCRKLAKRDFSPTDGDQDEASYTEVP